MKLPNLTSMTKLSRRAQITIAAVAIGALLIAIAAAAFAGQPQQRSWEISAPPGTKFEVNAPRADMVVSRDQRAIRVAVEVDDVKSKAKGRWYYAGQNCYADGYLDEVLTSLERCAAKAVVVK